MNVDQDLSKVAPQVYQSKINVPYSWWAGDTAAAFFARLAEKSVVAGRCEECGAVSVPPRKACPGCGSSKVAENPLPGTGTVTGFTVARRQLAALGSKKVPVVFALIRLDGADNAFLHMLGGCAPEDVKIGMKVKPVFADEPKGGIMDIAHFAPA